MKPDFALLLSFDGIALLRRADGDTEGRWYKLGDVAPETENLPKALADLRNSALAEGGDPAEVKLVLPTEQVRFLDIPARSVGTSPVASVESALDGATPYAIDDLVYDYEAGDGKLHIAAVARETLEEAESFALVIIQSLQFGTSLTTALKSYAKEMREYRELAAQEKANRLPVQMSGVMSVMMLPALFLITLGPTVIRYLSVFGD